MQPDMTPPTVATRATANRRLAWLLVLVMAGFFGFGFALVPLYNTFCQLTGLNGKTGDADSAPLSADTNRWVTVDFTSTVMPGLPWRFQPEQRRLRVHPGIPSSVTYLVQNRSDRTLHGQAIMSVSPEVAARHFKKIQCFCYSRQTLRPGEKRQLLLTFFMLPDLPGDVHTVTLSYALFPVDGHTS